MNWEAGTERSSRGVDETSPCPQPPGQGCASWEWVTQSAPHTRPVVPRRKGTEAGAGQEVA